MPTEEFYAGQSNYIRKLNDLWDRATTSVFGTSTDSLSVTTGSKSFTTNTNLQFAAGGQVTITATADLSKYMSGQVTAYDQDTGAIVVNVTSVVGSGTFSSWSITLSGAMGATGDAGIADNLSIGTVTSGAAAASITGTSPNKFLNLTLQTGATGAAGAPNVLSIGTVTGGATASATITGTSPSQVLNLVLPKGDTGDTGATGATGLTARGAWNASTAYVTSPSVDWVTYAGSSYYRKVAGTTPTDPATDTTSWGVLALKGADGSGTVAGVTASAPLASSGGATPNITITQANGSTNGFLSASDWNTFNGKQAALGYTPANKAGDTFTGDIGLFKADSSAVINMVNTSSTSARFPTVTIRNFSGGFGGNSAVELIAARGTSVAPSSVVGGDILGGFNTWGHNGTTSISATRIDGVAEATFSSDVKAGISFKTTTGGVQTQKMYLTGGGKLLLGTSDNGVDLLQVGGSASIVANSSTPALKISQTGTGNAFVVSDAASDTTPFVIDADGRLILGHTSSVAIGGAEAGFQNYSVAGFQTSMRSSADAGGVVIRYTKTRGTTPTSVDTVVSGDVIADILFSATDGTSHVNGALIRAVIDGVPATGSMPARLVFSTTPTGSASPVERMRINNAGNLLVGGTTDTGEKLQVTGTAKVTGTITATNVVTNGYTAGYLEIPVAAQSANYTFTLADSGQAKLHPSADTTARTFTVPANSSVAFPIGTAITIINQHGGGVITIAITTDVMRLAGAGTTGSRSLAANGIATLIKVTTTEWIISGVNLT